MKPQDIVLKLNQKGKADFALEYTEHTPRLSSLAFNSDARNKDSIKQIFAQFLTGLRVFTGNRIYEKPSKNWDLVIHTQKGDKGLEVAVDDINELSEKGPNFDIDRALETWISPLKLLGKMAKDYPFNHILHIIENGTSNQPLSAFGITAKIVGLDGEPLFSEDHAYDSVSGTFPNLHTGAGTSISQLETSLIAIVDLLQSMVYYPTGAQNSEKRFLNENISKVNIHCPAGLKTTFMKLKGSQSLSVTGDNVIAPAIINEITSHPFTDPTDYYVEVVDAETPMMRPFINQQVYPPRLDTASMSDASVKENDMLRYGVRTKHGIGIGAFWKIGKVINPNP